MTVIPFRHVGNPERCIDFDLYVDLLITHQGMTRRDAEMEVWREARRDNLSIARSDPLNGYRPIEDGALSSTHREDAT